MPTTELASMDQAREQVRGWLAGGKWWVFIVSPDHLPIAREIERRHYSGRGSSDCETLIGWFPFSPWRPAFLIGMRKRRMRPKRLAQALAQAGVAESVGDLLATLSDHDIVQLAEEEEGRRLAPIIARALAEWLARPGGGDEGEDDGAER